MRLPHRIRREDGFTFLEVLIVCVIVGLLAAIALPNFVGRDAVAMDADAKSNVRNLFAHVQSCFAEKNDYTLCDEADELDSPGGIVWGTEAGEVDIRRTGDHTTRLQVTIRGSSEAVTDGVRHQFTFVKRSGSSPDTRTCRSGEDDRAGGCHDGSW